MSNQTWGQFQWNCGIQFKFQFQFRNWNWNWNWTYEKKNGIGIGIGIEPNSVNFASIPFELFFNPLSFFILNIRFSSHFLHFKNESTGLLKPVLSYIFHSKKCTCYKDESQYCTAWPSFIHTLGSVYIYVIVKPFVIFMKV